MNMQTTNTVLMIRPVHFMYNAETAVNNKFQVAINDEAAHAKALDEFDAFVEKLRSNGIDVTVINEHIRRILFFLTIEFLFMRTEQLFYTRCMQLAGGQKESNMYWMPLKKNSKYQIRLISRIMKQKILFWKVPAVWF